MYGDFSRNPFSQKYRITRVLFNQGQPLIEADLNEALYSVIENQRYISESEVILAGSLEGRLLKGKLESPIGGFKNVLGIEVPGEGTNLLVAQHPFSLAYLSQRLSDKRLIHSVEMWGLRLALSNSKESSLPPDVLGTFKRIGRIPDDWLIRVEVHSVVNSKVTFKIDTHNAGYANICTVNGKTVTLDKGSRFVRPIRSGEFIEVQTAIGDFIIPSAQETNLIEIDSTSEFSFDFNLRNKNAEVAAEQCRFWKWSAKGDELKNGEWNAYFSFDIALESLQPGMFWLIDASELNTVWKDGKRVPATPENAAPIRVASQHPQFVYSKIAGTPNVRPPMLNNPDVEVSLPAHSRGDCFHLRDLPCGRLASGTSTPVIRRWLASMTLGELEGLDAEQVRSRLVRDCNLRLDDLPNIDDEIGRLVALRDQYFGSPRSALA
jgi:hypothetical protein